MSRRRKPSFTEKRRARLAMKWDRLEKLETKNTITEPISVLGLSISAFRGLAQLGIMSADGGNSGLLTLARLSQQASQASCPSRRKPRRASPTPFRSVSIWRPKRASGGGGAVQDTVGQTPTSPPNAPADLPGLTFAAASNASQPQGLSAPWQPAAPLAGGGALPPRGGSGGPSPALVAAASPPQAPPHSPINAPNSPAGSSSAAASSALLSALGLGGAGSAASPTISRNAAAAALNGTTDHGQLTTGKPLNSSGSSPSLGGIHPDVSPAFELETLDYNDGSVMVPGFEQLATPGGSVDLRAQVRDSATGTYTYSWSTTGLTERHQHQRLEHLRPDVRLGHHHRDGRGRVGHAHGHRPQPRTRSARPTPSGYRPARARRPAARPGTTTTLDPGLLQAGAPAFASQNVSVVEDTGALETSINLPSYNPNIPALSLNYDSLAANALPIIVAEHPLDPDPGRPLAGLGPVDLRRHRRLDVLLQHQLVAARRHHADRPPGPNAATLDTGSYPYTMTIADIRGGTPTTFTYTGNATIENAAEDPTFSALGAGWTVGGLEKIVPATGGVILDEGSGSVAWFSGSFGGGGGTYTSPAGTFSTLVLNGSGTLHPDRDRRHQARTSTPAASRPPRSTATA